MASRLSDLLLELNPTKEKKIWKRKAKMLKLRKNASLVKSAAPIEVGVRLIRKLVPELSEDIITRVVRRHGFEKVLKLTGTKGSAAAIKQLAAIEAGGISPAATGLLESARKAPKVTYISGKISPETKLRLARAREMEKALKLRQARALATPYTPPGMVSVPTWELRGGKLVKVSSIRPSLAWGGARATAGFLSSLAYAVALAEFAKKLRRKEEKARKGGKKLSLRKKVYYALPVGAFGAAVTGGKGILERGIEQALLKALRVRK